MAGEIILPWPPKPLWPNFRSRSHWPKTRAAKQARQDGNYATKAAKARVGAGDVPVLLQATFFPPDHRARDYDNYASTLKSYADGMADALGVNDRHFRFQPPIIADVVPGGRVEVAIL
jgi:crossover junction endodeoxyribonuclease RusA